MPLLSRHLLLAIGFTGVGLPADLRKKKETREKSKKSKKSKKSSDDSDGPGKVQVLYIIFLSTVAPL